MADLSSYINIAANTVTSNTAVSTPGDISATGNISADNASFGGNINGAGNFDLDGNASIGGNLFVTGNINFSGNVTQISGNSGVFFGNASTGVGALYAGKTGYTPLPSTIVQMTGDDNAYIQTNLQNTNHGNTASMELAITADDGTDVTNYIDMGIAGSTWDGTQDNSLGTAVAARDGYLYVQGGATGGNLVLGTTTSGYAVKFNAGGPGSANTVAQISAGGFSTTGNVTGSYIFGNGSQLTGITVSGSNPVSTTGNVAGGNLIATGTVSATGNITANYFFGNVALANGFPATYGNSNVTTLLASYGSNTVSTTGNISAGYLFGNASQLTGLPATYGNSNVATLLAGFGSNTVSTTGNINAGNVTGAYIFGNVAFANGIPATYSNANVAAYLPIYSGNLNSGNIISSGNANINLDPAGTGIVAIVGAVSASGNITTAGNFIGNGAALTNVTVSVAGNVIGTQSNVNLVAGSYNWSFNNTGNLTLPGNTFAVNYANNTSVNVVTKFEGTWTVPTGNSTQSFTVSPSETYYMWVDCNIPNGILTWNATATITNTNVPVVGAQYAWVYNGGGTPIDFTSIPNQFIGTANTIVRSSVAPSATTNKFDFGINNTSGSAQTVRYGWIQISY